MKQQSSLGSSVYNITYKVQLGKAENSFNACKLVTFDTFMEFLQGRIEKCEGHRVII